jgi:hypothetical protein
VWAIQITWITKDRIASEFRMIVDPVIRIVSLLETKSEFPEKILDLIEAAVSDNCTGSLEGLVWVVLSRHCPFLHPFRDDIIYSIIGREPQHHLFEEILNSELYPIWERTP